MVQIDLRQDKNNKGWIKSFQIEAGGNILLDKSIILTGPETSILLKTDGNYTSNESKIIQGNEIDKSWHTRWWVKFILSILGAVFATIIIYYLGFR